MQLWWSSVTLLIQCTLIMQCMATTCKIYTYIHLRYLNNKEDAVVKLCTVISQVLQWNLSKMVTV